jgi:hypothetical protein
VNFVGSSDTLLPEPFDYSGGDSLDNSRVHLTKRHDGWYRMAM